MSQPVTNKIKTDTMKPLHDAKAHLNTLHLQLVELQAQLAGQRDLSLERSISATQHAIAQLEHPTITFATIGTTSSGKSTALNALIGAQIAPMDANELSAGLLTLEHHDGDWQLFAADAHGEAMGGVIATGQKAVYDCLNATMQDVIKRRITHPDAPSPTLDFVVRGPLFICDPDHPLKQQLGDSVRVRIFDLPGLRTVDDSHNAHIIQERINQAFSLVLIDRTGMFDHEKRKSLLKELDKIVHDLGGKDTMMAFLFNKIDIPNPGGKSADEHLREAQEEIRTHLKLRHPERFKLLPFSGILYFYTTCLLRSIADIDLANANRLRDGLLQDCGKQLSAALKHTMPAERSGPDYDRWRQRDDAYDNISRAQRYGDPSELSQLAQLAMLALESSAHALIWETLAERVRDNLATILLVPVVRPLNAVFVSSSSELLKIKTQASTGQIATLEELERQREGLSAYKVKLRKLIDEQGKETKDNLSQFITTYQLTNRARQDGEAAKREKSHQDFKSYIDAHNYPHGLHELDTLTEVLIAKLFEDIIAKSLHLLTLDANSLEKKQRDFQRELRFMLSGYDGGAEAIDALIFSIQQLRENGYREELAKRGSVEKLPTQITHSHKSGSIDSTLDREHRESGAKMQAFDKMEKLRAKLYLNIRRCASIYSQQWLSHQLNSLKDDFAALTTKLIEDAWRAIHTDLQREFKGTIAAQLIPTQAILPPTNIGKVPEDVFRLPLPSAKSDEVEDQVVGTHSFEVGSCFTSNKTEEIQGQVSYKILKTPSIDDIEEQLGDGITAGDKYFYNKLTTWLETTLRNAYNTMDTELFELLEKLDKEFDQHASKLQDHANVLIEHWEKIEAKTSKIEDTINTLRNSADITTGTQQ